MEEEIKGKEIPYKRFKEWVDQLTDQAAEEGDCYGGLLWLLEEILGFTVIMPKDGGRR